MALDGVLLLGLLVPQMVTLSLFMQTVLLQSSKASTVQGLSLVSVLLEYLTELVLSGQRDSNGHKGNGEW